MRAINDPDRAYTHFNGIGVPFTMASNTTFAAQALEVVDN